MSNNYYTHQFSDYPESSNQNYTRNLFTKSLIQNSLNLNSLPQILEKYSGNTSSLDNQFESQSQDLLKRPIYQQPLEYTPSLQELNNNEKDPRMKSGFYQERANFSGPQSSLNSLIDYGKQPLKSATSDDIFKRDFISFNSNEKGYGDEDIEEIENKADCESDKLNVYSKKIKKVKTVISNPIPIVKNQKFEYQPPQPAFQNTNNSIYINPKFLELKEFFGKDLNDLIRREHQKLPIFNRSKVILESIEKEQVVVISGDTGCGKSTQVPKYIYLDARSKNKKVKIVCTQPRRMAALNLAKRVANELDERLGGIVGYQISLDSRQNADTAILYVTNGIFLQSLIHDKTIFDEVTHVILDEVHERDIDSDFTMIAMKHLLKENPHIKLILMSATINVQLFVNYFSRDEIQNCQTKEYNYSLSTNSNKWEKLNNWEDFDPKVAFFNKSQMEEENIPWTNIKVKKEKELNPYGANKKIDRSKEMHLEQYNINMTDLPAYSIEIPSEKKNYYVKTFYIDTIENYLGKQLINGIEFRYIDFDRKKPALHLECTQLALEIIKNILTKDDQEKQKLNQNNSALPKHLDGSILIFLPGSFYFYIFSTILIFLIIYKKYIAF